MKKARLYSQPERSTKGGSLPGCDPRLERQRTLTLRNDKMRAGFRDDALAAERGETAVDGMVAGVLKAIVLERFRTESAGVLEPGIESRNGSPTPGSASSSPQPSTMSESHPPELPGPTRVPLWKRCIDLALLGCTVWAWLPLALLVTGLLKIVSPGPALYRQRRVGFRGKPFTIFKFRSMHLNSETRTHEQYVAHLMQADSPMTKLDNLDPRLIPCGRFLRTTGLDELPQILNVLCGEMSLVGPRPCTEVEFDRYLPEQRARVNAPPGITGFWQVNGKNKTTFNEMVTMDISYVSRMSPALDLAIIGKTIPTLLRQTYESFAVHPVKARVNGVALAKSNFERSQIPS